MTRREKEGGDVVAAGRDAERGRSCRPEGSAAWGSVRGSSVDWMGGCGCIICCPHPPTKYTTNRHWWQQNRRWCFTCRSSLRRSVNECLLVSPSPGEAHQLGPRHADGIARAWETKRGEGDTLEITESYTSTGSKVGVNTHALFPPNPQAPPRCIRY